MTRPRPTQLGVIAALVAAGGCPVRPAERADGRPAEAPPERAKEVAALPVPVLDEPLAAIVKEAQRDPKKGTYVAPSPKEMALVQALAENLAAAVAAAPPPAAPGGDELASHAGLGESWARVEEWAFAAATVGCDLVVSRAGDERFVVLREAVGVRRGGGVYALRPAVRGRPLILQAPHSFHDVGTGELARQVFEATDAAALALNTLHRYVGVPEGEREGDAPADLAHAPQSYFQGMTRGLSTGLARAVFCQLHGFSARGNPGLAGVDIVASKGDAAGVADAVFDRLVARLGTVAGGDRVIVYGRDPRARALGATRNVQGSYLNALSDDAFYHLELSSELRERLAHDPELRRSFGAALGALAAETP